MATDRDVTPRMRADVARIRRAAAHVDLNVAALLTAVADAYQRCADDHPIAWREAFRWDPVVETALVLANTIEKRPTLTVIDGDTNEAVR